MGKCLIGIHILSHWIPTVSTCAIQTRTNFCPMDSTDKSSAAAIYFIWEGFWTIIMIQVMRLRLVQLALALPIHRGQEGILLPVAEEIGSTSCIMLLKNSASISLE